MLKTLSGGFFFGQPWSANCGRSGTTHRVPEGRRQRNSLTRDELVAAASGRMPEQHDYGRTKRSFASLTLDAASAPASASASASSGASGFGTETKSHSRSSPSRPAESRHAHADSDPDGKPRFRHSPQFDPIDERDDDQPSAPPQQPQFAFGLSDQPRVKRFRTSGEYLLLQQKHESGSENQPDDSLEPIPDVHSIIASFALGTAANGGSAALSSSDGLSRARLGSVRGRPQNSLPLPRSGLLSPPSKISPRPPSSSDHESKSKIKAAGEGEIEGDTGGLLAMSTRSDSEGAASLALPMPSENGFAAHAHGASSTASGSPLRASPFAFSFGLDSTTSTPSKPHSASAGSDALSDERRKMRRVIAPGEKEGASEVSLRAAASGGRQTQSSPFDFVHKRRGGAAAVAPEPAIAPMATPMLTGGSHKRRNSDADGDGKGKDERMDGDGPAAKRPPPFVFQGGFSVAAVNPHVSFVAAPASPPRDSKRASAPGSGGRGRDGTVGSAVGSVAHTPFDFTLSASSVSASSSSSRSTSAATPLSMPFGSTSNFSAQPASHPHTSPFVFGSDTGAGAAKHTMVSGMASPSTLFSLGVGVGFGLGSAVTQAAFQQQPQEPPSPQPTIAPAEHESIARTFSGASDNGLALAMDVNGDE